MPSPVGDKTVAVSVINSSSNIASEVTDGKPAVKVTIKAEGNLAGSLAVSENITKVENIKKLDRLFSEKIRKEAGAALERARQMDADIFGFGESFKKHHPKYWKTVENKWHEIFRTLPVEVKVEANIRRTGLIDGDVVPK